MYEEGGEAGGAAPALGGVAKRINLEGLIPLILLVIIGVASLNYFGIVNVPYLPQGNTRVQMLIIGEPSLGEKVVLDNMSNFLSYRVRDAASFGNTSSEELQQYDIVMLDQSNLADKSVTTGLGSAVNKYVTKGGKLIVVLNSGIYQSVGFQGYTASDVIGWKATFGDIIPAECVPASNGVPSCKDGMEIPVVGRIREQIYDHPIMQGIETAPPIGDAPLSLRTLGIQANGTAKTVAYLQTEGITQTFPAILEQKNFPMGTVIYFNYDPGMTPGIFTNTINYLK